LDKDARITFSTTNTVANGISTTILPGRSLFSGALSRIDFIGVDITSANGGICFNLTAGNVFLPVLFLNKSRVQGFDQVGITVGVSIALENIAHLANTNGWDITDATILQIAEQNVVFSQGITYKISGTTGSAFYTTIESTSIAVDTTFDISGTIDVAVIDTLHVHPASGGAVFNIDSGLVVNNTFQISGGSVDTSSGGTMFAVGSLDQTDPRILVRDVAGTPSSQWKGSTGFTGNTTETVFADTSTWVKVEGTYVAGDLERFTEALGILTSAALEDISPTIISTVAIVPNPDIEDDVIELALFNGTTQISDAVQLISPVMFQGAPDYVYSVQMPIVIENPVVVTSDALQVKARNTSNATNAVFSSVRNSVRW